MRGLSTSDTWTDVSPQGRFQLSSSNSASLNHVHQWDTSETSVRPGGHLCCLKADPQPLPTLLKGFILLGAISEWLRRLVIGMFAPLDLLRLCFPPVSRSVNASSSSLSSAAYRPAPLEVSAGGAWSCPEHHQNMAPSRNTKSDPQISVRTRHLSTTALADRQQVREYETCWSVRQERQIQTENKTGD